MFTSHVYELTFTFETAFQHLSAGKPWRCWDFGKFPAVQVATKPGIFKPKHYLFLTLSEVIMPNKVTTLKVHFVRKLTFQSDSRLVRYWQLGILGCVRRPAKVLSWEQQYKLGKIEKFCSTNVELEHKDMYGFNISIVCLTLILVIGSGHWQEVLLVNSFHSRGLNHATETLNNHMKVICGHGVTTFCPTYMFSPHIIF